MKALLTGDAGFVGSHMARRLQEDGWTVEGCDLTRGDDCRTLFALDSRRFDLVVHCAAVVGGRLTISGDPLAVAVDLEIDAAMFRWAARTRQRRVVYFSSSAAYPTILQDPRKPTRLREDHICLASGATGVPDLTYGWAKLTGEVLAGYAEDAGVPVHVFRPFSGYGPGQSVDYPFPAYIQRARERRDVFEVWGDGQQTRDFVHIDDVVDCTLTAVHADYRQPLNIGTGRPTTFDELAGLCMDAAGYRAPIRHDTSKPTGPGYRVANTARMCEVWEPKVTLEQGIREALGT